MNRSKRGQVAVETAIILPVFVFLLLGLLQLSLMHQARVMTKYAAYKATRAGALRGAQKEMMERAALAVLLPVSGRDSRRGAFFPTDNSGNLRNAWNQMESNEQEGGLKVAEVTICNPLRGSLPDADRQDFDDPHTLSGGRAPSGGGGLGGGGSDGEDGASGDPRLWREFDANKLMAQVTHYYRLNIPFANWMIFRIAYAQDRSSTYDKMRWVAYDRNMSRATNNGGASDPRDTAIDARLLSAADSRRYIMPIRASYAMRMQSNLISSNLDGRQRCKVPWRKAS
jgi:hypothetical protein